MFIAVRRQIGASAGQSQAQWSARPDVEDWPWFTFPKALKVVQGRGVRPRDAVQMGEIHGFLALFGFCAYRSDDAS
jgi:hypothetical protein